MADTKISALTSATVPLAGTEVLPIVQGGTTVKVPVSDLTAGRAIAASAATITGATTAVSLTLANTGGGTNATFAVTENTGVTLNLNEGATARQLIIQQGGVETWRFNASGNFAAADGKGIDFSATAGTGTSELLADYEEGTWTPVVAGSTIAGTYELSSSNATYTKIGRQVTLICYLRFAAIITGLGAGSLTITGLPFAKTSGPYPIGQVLFDGVDWTAGANLCCSFGTVSVGSTIFFEQTNDNAGSSGVQITGVSANDYIFFTISYWA
jgi:hypothetical protein